MKGKPDDLLGKGQSKTFSQIQDELQALLPNHPLRVLGDSPKWKRYDMKKAERWVSEAEHVRQGEEFGKQNEALAKVCYDQQVDITKLKAEKDKALKETKTDLTKQELMKIFEEQIELKNAEVQKFKAFRDNAYKKWCDSEERLEAIQTLLEKCPTWEEARQKSTATNKIEEEQIPAHLILIDMWVAWAKKVLGVLLNPTEKNDVEVSRQEIGQGQSKKFTKAEELLKELKEGDSK